MYSSTAASTPQQTPTPPPYSPNTEPSAGQAPTPGHAPSPTTPWKPSTSTADSSPPPSPAPSHPSREKPPPKSLPTSPPHTTPDTTPTNTLQPLIEATQQFASTHTTADLRILLTSTPPHALTETITHTRETLNGTPLTLAGLHANTPTEAQHLADTAAQTQLTLCINAHSHLTQAAATAQTIRRTHPHLTLRLDTIKTTPEETLNDQELQALANSRISLGLQTTAENADLARRANTIGTPISIGSDPTLDAPLGWQAVKIFATAPRGISARSAFAALTRSPHRALADANPFAGQLVPDTPANLAIWNVTELMVQAPDSRVASWSTDPRARIPLLPALDVPLPTLERLYTQEQ